MELYFIRHAVAVNRMESQVKSDEERWLTEDGIQKMKCASQGLRNIVPQFNVIYTSPYVRARQTAEIVAEAYGNNPPCRDLDALQPGADLSAIKAAVKKQPSSSRIALVGHEPDLSELISLLVTGSTRPQIEMKKGAVCRVDIEDQPIPGSGVLVWLLPAKILQMIK